MKLIFSLFLLLITVNVFPQSSNIDDGDWHLIDLNINSESNHQLILDFGRSVPLTFSTTNENTRNLVTAICDIATGEIIVDENNLTITLSQITQTLGGCSEEAGPYYSLISKLYEFYNNFNLGTIFSYQLIEENGNQPKTLIITNSDGDYATYFFNTLSINERTNKLVYSIYPNPVKNKLFISSPENLKNYKLEVFDILGKVKISKRDIDSNSIDVKNLPKGIYILMITNDLGHMAMEKFVK